MDEDKDSVVKREDTKGSHIDAELQTGSLKQEFKVTMMS